jgi:hypothetical protein
VTLTQQQLRDAQKRIDEYHETKANAVLCLIEALCEAKPLILRGMEIKGVGFPP